VARDVESRTVLGLDLGVTSVGWALVEMRGDAPVGIRAIGVRHFDTAATSEKEFEAGRHKTKNADRRRPQRQMRRQLQRRKTRKKQAFAALQAAGLLPAASAQNEDQRHKVIRQVDARLRRKWLVKGDHRQQQLLPYLLRDAASRREVTAEELGRALFGDRQIRIYHPSPCPLPCYSAAQARERGQLNLPIAFHLAQRRGFKSNRKTDRDDDDQSKVYAGIGKLAEKMQAAGCETYGQYFATLDPQEIDRRIRGRYTSREQYQKEFDKIIATQLPFHPQLAPHVKAIRRAIFYQNPLKSQRQFLGKCELEENRRRAPKACLEFQRYRVCYQVNNLSLEAPTGHREPLTPEQRQTLYTALEHKEKLTAAGILKELGYKRNSGYAVQGIGESGKEIIGNRTACKLQKELGPAWDHLEDDDRTKLVDEIIQFTNPTALARRLIRLFGFSEEDAHKAANAHLDGDYASYSRVALKKLLPLLKAGHTLPAAKEMVYGEEAAGEELASETPTAETHSRDGAGPFLPPLYKTKPGRYVRNPVVMRCLSELRKVVNHILREHGLPGAIRIELLRDLKRSKKVREERHKNIKKNQERNERIKQHLLSDAETKRFFAHDPPKRADVDKWKLFEECDGECPYTGRKISPGDLYGPSPQFDIEHIVPASKFPDNSLANKTLCEHHENRQRKKNQTPWDAYHGTDQYDQIIARVKKFKGPLAGRKLELFQQRDLPVSMTAQQLVDSQYTASLAADYLATLYGGQVDASGRRRVVATNGRVTSHLRGLWRLNELIGSEDGQKNRADLRHHAIDALVVALTGPAAVARLARFVQEGEGLGLDNPFAARHHRRPKPFDLPWDGFREEAQRKVLEIVVSHRPERRLVGQLHNDTMYRGPGRRGSPSPNLLTQRVELVKLRREQIEGDALVSPLVRRCALEKLRTFDQPGKKADPQKVFKDETNLPLYPGRNGQPPHVIRRVKIYKSMSKTISVRKANAKGHYEPGGNHHVPILVEVDAAGNEQRDNQGRPILKFGDVVSRFDAVKRLKKNAGEVIERDCGPGLRLKFTLMRGDIVEMEDDEGMRRLYRLQKLSQNDFSFRAIHLAEGDEKTLKGRKDLFIRETSPARFSRRSPRKVIVDPLGRVHNCGG